MNLATGTRLGPYELLSPLGKGGMGEVYLARDTRLNRQVAIKLLPASFAADEGRLLRFEEEARTTSRLNHPNILTIYDIGTQEGSPYLVAELLEGEELRQQLRDGALPTRLAIDYAQQITSGLAAAHEKGIIHRDLKPENLFVTTDGRVKILDFGLAKLRPPQSEPVESDVATQKAITDPGVVVGTVGYMSPEQVRGQHVDHRSDIFSLGAVLYEMLTGRRAFLRETMAETMTAILKEEPDEVAQINSKVPPQVGRIVQRCLEKKPERRFQTASDLCFALETLSTPSGSQAGAAAPVVVRGKNRERLAWIVAGALLLGLVAALPFAIAYFRRQPTEVRGTRFVIPPSEKQSFINLSISPDGRHLVYYASAADKGQMWIRHLDSLTAQPLPGTEKTTLFGRGVSFWSPDSRSIGFFADGRLKTMEISGGPAQTVADAPEPRGGSWNRDGVIVFSPTALSPLYRVSATAGEMTQLTTLDESRQENSHRWPLFLPDGRHFLFLAQGWQPENNAIYVGSLDSKERKRLINADSNVAYAPPGYLLFAREGALMAQPFDADKLEVTGEPFRVVEQISYEPQIGLARFSVSEEGALVYLTGNPPPNQLTWFDRSGKPLGTVGPPGTYRFLRLSPDEKRVAVERIAPPAVAFDIWLIDLARGVPSRFTSEPGEDFLPVWSPDGSRIAFSSDKEGVINLYQKLSSGAGGYEELFISTEYKGLSDWSADGRFILYRTQGGKTKWDIWVLPMFGDSKPYPFLQAEFGEFWAVLSPDGRWVAYTSDETGTSEMYVREFQGSGGKYLVSTGGTNTISSSPRWRRDGKELFYTRGGELMAVEVKAEGLGIELGAPKLLFARNGIRGFDVSRDGQRFLVAVPVEETSPEPITVVLNWTANLKQ